MKVFGVAGYKNSGKTTLVTELIAELRSRRYRVATVKHAHHSFDIDHPGKDSYLHRQAGAAEVIVVSAQRWAHIAELRDEPEPGLRELLVRLSHADIVLVEGYKHGNHPKLELRRSGIDAPGLFAGDATVKFVVSDQPEDVGDLPLISRADVAAIADGVLRWAEVCQSL